MKRKYQTHPVIVNFSYQSYPTAKDVSITGAMSFAAVMMYFSAMAFLCQTNKNYKETWYKFFFLI